MLAAFFALRQSNYKRLLAYSSIEHMGIVSLGIGIGGPIAAYGAFFHVVVHAAGKTLAFFGAGDLLSRYESREVDEVRGVIRAAPFTGAMVLLGALAIAGVPPFGIFRSELLIVTGGFSNSSFALAGLLVRVRQRRVRRGLSDRFTGWCCLRRRRRPRPIGARSRRQSSR